MESSPPPDRAPPPSAPTIAGAATDLPKGFQFRAVAPETFEAGLLESEPATRLERLKEEVLGPPIPEQRAGTQRLNPVRALAILSSDALSSVAYGTEASLTVLVAAGAAALVDNLGIGLVIAVLMVIVAASYRQTIHAYPNGGGSYIVSRANLGTLPGLVAAAALLLDYLLTVSVSVAAGIDAIAAALPALAPLRLPLDVGIIALIVLINLRGLRTSGTIFALPTYLFLASFGLMLALGVWRAVMAGGLTAAVHPSTTGFAGPAQALTPLLLLTAFASGCSAMTGVEAISNGVPAFEGDTPQVQARRAARTLTIMIALLVTLFLGTTYLAWRIGATPTPSGEPTVTSQIARFAYAGATSWLFYVVQGATLLILIFAANTSFADFPRVTAILARDGFLPASFAYRGERTAFTTGIVVLGALSALVLWVFRGSVVGLINLYALGVFTAFTLSQSGMVVHWLRRRDERGWRRRLLANGMGALATAVVAVVIAVAKFDRGAWVIVVLVPLLVLAFLGIRRYYERPHTLHLPPAPPLTADLAFMPVLTQLGTSTQGAPGRHAGGGTATGSRAAARQQARLHVVEQELAFAGRVAPEVVLVQVVNDASEAEQARDYWDRFVERCAASGTAVLPARVRVEALISPYRTSCCHWRTSWPGVPRPHRPVSAWPCSCRASCARRGGRGRCGTGWPMGCAPTCEPSMPGSPSSICPTRTKGNDLSPARGEVGREVVPLQQPPRGDEHRDECQRDQHDQHHGRDDRLEGNRWREARLRPGRCLALGRRRRCLARFWPSLAARGRVVVEELADEPHRHAERDDNGRIDAQLHHIADEILLREVLARGDREAGADRQDAPRRGDDADEEEWAERRLAFAQVMDNGAQHLHDDQGQQ